jgi:hypothetical protein
MKYVGNATPAYPFGIKHNISKEEKHLFSSICNSTKKVTQKKFRNSVCFGPGPGSYNVHLSEQKILSRAPVCTIGHEKRKVNDYNLKTALMEEKKLIYSFLELKKMMKKSTQMKIIKNRKITFIWQSRIRKKSKF